MKKIVLIAALGTIMIACKKEEKDTSIPSNTYRVEINANEITNMVQPNYDIRVIEDENNLLLDTIVSNDDSTFVFEWNRPNKKIVSIIFNGNSTTSVNIKLFKNGIIEDYAEGYNNISLNGVY
jgi:hypothetical protein